MAPPTRRPSTDHDLLIRIDERTENMDIMFKSHLRHHWRWLLMVAAAALGTAFTAIFWVFELHQTVAP